MIISIKKLIFNFNKYNNNPDIYIPLHKKGDFYKKVLENVKKNGIKNPLLVEDLKNGTYKVCIGNNRLLVAKELKYKELNCIILPNTKKETLLAYKKKYYKKVNDFIT